MRHTAWRRWYRELAQGQEEDETEGDSNGAPTDRALSQVQEEEETEGDSKGAPADREHD